LRFFVKLETDNEANLGIINPILKQDHVFFNYFLVIFSEKIATWFLGCRFERWMFRSLGWSRMSSIPNFRSMPLATKFVSFNSNTKLKTHNLENEWRLRPRIRRWNRRGHCVYFPQFLLIFPSVKADPHSTKKGNKANKDTNGLLGSSVTPKFSYFLIFNRPTKAPTWRAHLALNVTSVIILYPETIILRQWKQKFSTNCHG
jgi:hypothetical protein